MTKCQNVIGTILREILHFFVKLGRTARLYMYLISPAISLCHVDYAGTLLKWSFLSHLLLSQPFFFLMVGTHLQQWHGRLQGDSDRIHICSVTFGAVERQVTKTSSSVIEDHAVLREALRTSKFRAGVAPLPLQNGLDAVVHAWKERGTHIFFHTSQAMRSSLFESPC